MRKFKFGELRKSILVDGGNQNEGISIFDWKDYCRNGNYSNDKDMIKFQYGEKIIRFRGPYSLERFTSVKEWDNGYMVVMAKYQHNQESEEEYIDLIPILKDLYIDAVHFLKPIKEVRLAYGQN